LLLAPCAADTSVISVRHLIYEQDHLADIFRRRYVFIVAYRWEFVLIPIPPQGYYFLAVATTMRI
jgi:hypothetical protein